MRVSGSFFPRIFQNILIIYRIIGKKWTAGKLYFWDTILKSFYWFYYKRFYGLDNYGFGAFPSFSALYGLSCLGFLVFCGFSHFAFLPFMKCRDQYEISCSAFCDFVLLHFLFALLYGIFITCPYSAWCRKPAGTTHIKKDKLSLYGHAPFLHILTLKKEISAHSKVVSNQFTI